MMSQRDDAEVRRIRGQGRILEALAGGAALLDRLERRFGLAHEELRARLLVLAYAGWITIRVQPSGRVTIHLEQEGVGAQPVTVAGVSSVAAWRSWLAWGATVARYEAAVRPVRGARSSAVTCAQSPHTQRRDSESRSACAEQTSPSHKRQARVAGPPHA